MKTLLCKWWVGMMIVTIGSAPFKIMGLLDRLEPDLIHGMRPLWWRILSFAIAIGVLIAAPLLVQWGAREIIRTEGWLAPAKSDRSNGNGVAHPA
jgi:hypothetical protein